MFDMIMDFFCIYSFNETLEICLWCFDDVVLWDIRTFMFYDIRTFYGWELYDMFVLMKNLYLFLLIKLIQEFYKK